MKQEHFETIYNSEIQKLTWAISNELSKEEIIKIIMDLDYERIENIIENIS